MLKCSLIEISGNIIVFTKSYEIFPNKQLDKFKSEKQKFFTPSLFQLVEEKTNEINKNKSPEKNYYSAKFSMFLY